MLGAIASFMHVVAVIQNSYGIYYDYNYVTPPSKFRYDGSLFILKGRLKFLTYWCLLIQTLYFTICVLVDVTNSSKLRKFKNNLHARIAFPIAMFVGLTFWAIFAVDRELVFPKALDPYFPNWLNHLMHTNIMVFTVIEMLTTYRQYPKRSTGIKTLSVFMLAYLTWMHVIYFVSGFWVYPIMEVLSTPLRIVFFIVLFGFVGGLYILGEKLNSVVWGPHKPTEKLH